MSAENLNYRLQRNPGSSLTWHDGRSQRTDGGRTVKLLRQPGTEGSQVPAGPLHTPGPCPGAAPAKAALCVPPPHQFPAGASLLPLQGQAYRSRFAESSGDYWAVNYSNVCKYNNLMVIIRLGLCWGQLCVSPPLHTWSWR